MDMTYGEYLKLPELLKCQEVKTPHARDELLFIIIHQTYELWFKQILHEYQNLIDCVQERNSTQSMKRINRILKILKTIVSQMDILETMDPVMFKQFRQNLGTSSGFQSIQFRLLEYHFGVKPAEFPSTLLLSSEERTQLQEVYEGPTL